MSPRYVGATGPYRQRRTHDVAQGPIGRYDCARDDWHLAPLRIDNDHAPEGGHLLLSDGPPLPAIPAKPIYRLARPAETTPPVCPGT